MSNSFEKVVEIGSLGLIDGGDATGSNAAEAARQASATQVQAMDRAIDLQRETRDLAREDLSPFRDFGQGNIDQLQSLLTPDGQMAYLQNNPLFQASLDNVNSSTLAANSVGGLLNSGNTIQALQDNYMATAQPMIASQQNALFNAVNMGQNSAAGQANTALSTGNNISSLIGQQGNAAASGIVGAQGAQQAAFNNLLNLGGQAGSAAMMAFSDARLKENIEKVGEDDKGNIYQFNYIGDSQRYEGRIAQELRKTNPDEVMVDEESGYLLVTEPYYARAV